MKLAPPPPSSPASATGSLYLVRHPAVAVPPGTCYGRSDVALGEAVAPVAARVRAQLPAHFVLHASPLTRARLLAEALGTPQLNDGFMELDFGRWEMLDFETIGRSAIDGWAADPLGFCAHGGESVRQMAERALAATQRALQQAAGLPVVIVAHAGPIRAIAGTWQGLAPAEWMLLPIDYGGVLQLRPPAAALSLPR